MNNEKDYLEAFEIISEAGDAQSKAALAIEKFEEFEFEAGEKLLEEAEESFHKAHLIQTQLIQKEFGGVERVDMNILVVHSQDHFTMANTAINLAKVTLKLYKQLFKMKGEM